MVGRYVACDPELWPIKNSFCAFLARVKTYTHSHTKIKHVHLLVLIWEQLHTPTTTMQDATVQLVGWHITNKVTQVTFLCINGKHNNQTDSFQHISTYHVSLLASVNSGKCQWVENGNSPHNFIFIITQLFSHHQNICMHQSEIYLTLTIHR